MNLRKFFGQLRLSHDQLTPFFLLPKIFNFAMNNLFIFIIVF